MKSKEGFTNIQVTSCPNSTKNYITSTGDTNCCDGDTVNKTCNGSILCSLSPQRPGSNIQTCSAWMSEQYKSRSARFCPASMPNYFGTITRVPGTEGCTSSAITSDGLAPQDITQSQCKIYSNEKDEYANVDSCFNLKALDSMNADGVKSVLKTDGVALLTSTGIPKDGSSVVPVTCYDYNRVIQYLQTNRPDVADKLTKDKCATVGSFNICGVQCKKTTYSCISGLDYAIPNGSSEITCWGNNMTKEKAEEACNKDPNCTSYNTFSSDGGITIGACIKRGPPYITNKNPIVTNMCFKNSSDAALPVIVVPKKGTILGKINISENYILSFDITPYGIIGEWGSILHFTSDGENCCNFGSRSPGIWFDPNQLSLHVRVGDSADGNWGFDGLAGITLNNKTHVKIECIDKSVKITIGSNLYSMTQPNRRYSGPVTVFGSDPFYTAANVVIENLSYKSI